MNRNYTIIFMIKRVINFKKMITYFFKTESISLIAYLFSHSLHPQSQCPSHMFSMVSHLNVFLTCLLILEPHTLILVPLTEARRKRIALGKGLFYLSIYPSIYQYIYISIYLSFYLFIHLYLSLYIFIYSCYYDSI